MRRILALFLTTIAFNALAGSPAQDKVVAKYRDAFKASKGTIWDMTKDDGVYFACHLYNARNGGAEKFFFNFRVSNDGDINIMNTNLATGRFSGVPLLPTTSEVVGVRGAGDSGDPLELIALRVGKPISMEKPMIDSWVNDGVPERIMSRPLYVEVSQIQDGRSVGYETKPLSDDAKLDSRYRVKEYGVCVLSKENSRLNNSGRGYAGNTRSAWDGAAIWGGVPHRGGGY